MIYEIYWYNYDGEDMQFFAELTGEQAEIVRRRLQAANDRSGGDCVAGNHVTPLTVLSPIDLDNTLDEWLEGYEENDPDDTESDPA